MSSQGQQEKNVAGIAISPLAESETRDKAELQAQGHEAELPRHFGTFSIIGFAFAILASWAGCSATLGLGLSFGSSAALVWGILLAAAITAVITLGMSELASCFPCSGGVYHWAFIVTSEKHAPLMSFVTGWFNLFGWWVTAGSVAIFCSAMCSGLGVMWNPDFEIQKWQMYLLYIAFTSLFTGLNVLCAGWLPRLNCFIRW